MGIHTNKEEAKFWRQIRTPIKRLGRVSRVESHDTAIGIPDVNLCSGGIDYWIELKVAGPSGDIEIRPSQKMWHKRQRMAGGTAFVLIKATTKDQTVYLLSSDINLGDHIKDHWDRSFIWYNEIEWNTFEGALRYEKEQRQAEVDQSIAHAQSVRGHH